MTSNRRTAYRVRLYGAGAGVAAAAMIGMGSAHADTPTDVIGQAITDLNQGTDVLETASTTDLSTQYAGLLADSETFNDQLAALLPQYITLQDQFSAADQTSLATTDEDFVTAAANIASADQAFVTAADAGDLSGSGYNSTDLAMIEGALGFLRADWDVSVAGFHDIFTGGIDTTSAADSASSLDPAGAAATLTDPATTLLTEATASYTASNGELATLLADTSASVTAYDPMLDAITNFQDGALQNIGWLDTAETSLWSYHNGVLDDLLSPWFTKIDDAWVSVSSAALTADQTAESVVDTGSATDTEIATAMLGLLGPEYRGIGPLLQLVGVDLADKLVTGTDPVSAVADSASAIDPSIFADLLSSIGL